MTTAEKLTKIAENMQEVFKAGQNTTGLTDVSLLDVNAEGKLTAVAGVIKGLTDELITMENGEVDIFLTGYIEFSLHIVASAYVVTIDDREYQAADIGDPFKVDETVHFAGKIFDKIRISGFGFDEIRFENLVEGSVTIGEIYNNGLLAGEESGYDVGYEAGKTAEWNEFWDGFQESGARIAYNNAFQNGWTDDMFRPRYDIRPVNAGYMFAGTKIANLKKCLEDNGVVLDLSGATSVDRIFSDAPNLTYVPVISTVNAPHMQNFFYNCKKLVSVDTVTLKDDGSQTFNDNSFKNCESLVEIRFSGMIGNDINLQWSKNLSMGSLASIVDALSTSVSGKTITLPSTARATYDNATYGGRWDEIVAEHPNWEFKYA